MSSEKKLFLLDAFALIFRAYYAFISRPIRNSKGVNTSAVFGFVNTLDEVLRKEKPTHIAVGFDPPAPTFRHQMFDAYKANREATPPDIIASVPYIKRLLEAYKIPILEYEGFEADDVIGTVAKRAHKDGFTVYMMTPDKDYAQLVDDGIFMYKPRRAGDEAEIWGPAEVMQKFEIQNPIQVIDILALWGDSSDNVPGAPGIGEKTAKKLIAQYGSVENLLANTADLKGKQKESLEKNREQVELSKTLVTIDIDVPVSIQLDELKCQEFDRAKLKDLFQELEFRTLSQRILGGEKVQPPSSQPTLFDTPTQESPVEVSEYQIFDKNKVNYQLVQSEKDWEELIHELDACDEFCFDTETTGLDVLNVDIIGLSISTSSETGWYISCDGDKSSSIEKLGRIKQFLISKEKTKIAHNLKYDSQILRKYNIEVCAPYFDTMVAHYLLHPESKHKLDRLTENILGYKMISIEALLGKKGKNQLNMRDIPVSEVCNYACEDADLTYRLYKKLRSELTENQLDELAKNIEFPLIQVLAEMELAGINVNVETLNNYAAKLEIEIRDIEKQIYSHAEEEFNIASPKQLGIILFEKLKISANTKMTKTKQYSTGEEILQRLRDAHPIVDLILDYRSVTKLQSTYVTALPKMIDSHTNRIHSSFMQTIAATGRLSSINPNLQNIPIREARGREIRKAFIPADEQHSLLSADYSQIELRLMAHMSGDEDMLKAFNEGADIHQSTAAKVYKITPEEVTREMRSKAKTANFGIIYGISAFGLSQRLLIPRSEAKELIDNYFKNYPKVSEYMNHSIEMAKKHGYVTTLFGRKRYLPDINASNSIVRSVAERNAINSPIQGSAADIIKIAMIRIQEKLKNKFASKMILQVHDELVFDVLNTELDEIKKIVKFEMENAAQLNVALLVEMDAGKNWLEAH